MPDPELLAGISFLPITIPVFVASSSAPKLVARVGVRSALVVGLSMATLGFLVPSTVTRTSAYELAVLPGGVLTAFGALSLVAGTIVAVKGVPGGAERPRLGRRQHLAPGGRHPRTGGPQHPRHPAHGQPAGRRPRTLDALTDGYKLAFRSSAGICAIGVLVATTLIPRNLDPLPQFRLGNIGVPTFPFR